MAEWGEQEEHLLAFEAESGITSKALENKPTLDVVLTWYFDEYHAISLSRNYVEAVPRPLTTGQILLHCNLYGYTDQIEFHRMMRLIDSVWLQCRSEKQKATSVK